MKNTTEMQFGAQTIFLLLFSIYNSGGFFFFSCIDIYIYAIVQNLGCIVLPLVSTKFIFLEAVISF